MSDVVRAAKARLILATRCVLVQDVADYRDLGVGRALAAHLLADNDCDAVKCKAVIDSWWSSSTNRGPLATMKEIR